MITINLSDDVAIGRSRRNMYMFDRHKMRTYAYRKLFKLNPADDINLETGEPYKDDDIREVLSPTRMRPTPTGKRYPRHSTRECERRIRQRAA